MAKSLSANSRVFLLLPFLVPFTERKYATFSPKNIAVNHIIIFIKDNVLHFFQMQISPDANISDLADARSSYQCA